MFTLFSSMNIFTPFKVSCQSYKSHELLITPSAVASANRLSLIGTVGLAEGCMPDALPDTTPYF